MTATGHRPGSHPVLRRASVMDRVREIARRLGISRTTVWNALQRRSGAR